jgi:hypothetical protein
MPLQLEVRHNAKPINAQINASLPVTFTIGTELTTTHQPQQLRQRNQVYLVLAVPIASVTVENISADCS